MNYVGCSVINDSFSLGSDGSLWSAVGQMKVEDRVVRAYVFVNLFFYDIVENEIGKIVKKINKQKEILLASTNIDPTATETIYPQLSNMVKAEFKTDLLEGLVKLELAKIKPHISLEMTGAEKETMSKMKESVFYTEFDKFKKNLLIIDDYMDEPKEVIFTQDYINSLTRRAKRLLSPAIKMVALLQKMSFDEFALDSEYHLKYRWSRTKNEFNEEEIKDKVKEIIRNANNAEGNT
jgi:Icc-related predicted phosphoesterase